MRPLGSGIETNFIQANLDSFQAFFSSSSSLSPFFFRFLFVTVVVYVLAGRLAMTDCKNVQMPTISIVE